MNLFKKYRENRRIISECDKKWNSYIVKDLDKFRGFIKDEYKELDKKFFKYTYFYGISDFENLQNYLRKNAKLYTDVVDDFILHLKTEESERNKQKEISKELDDIENRIIKDFLKNPYRDKFDISSSGLSQTILYTFEEGDTCRLQEKKLTYSSNKTIYTLGMLSQLRFLKLFATLLEKSKQRPAGSSRRKPGSTGDPNRDKYNKLKEKIGLREDQLRKMKSNDPEREALQNELDNYKRAAKRMKDQYKFENIYSDMKHLQTINEFNLFRRKPDDEIAWEFITRLKKVKDRNPYEIKIIHKDPDDVATDPMSEYECPPYAARLIDDRTDYSLIYIVRFDDVDLIITNNGYNIYGDHGRGNYAGFKKVENQYILIVAEEMVYAKDKYRKRIFELVDKIYKEDKTWKRINKIRTEINPAADLL